MIEIYLVSDGYKVFKAENAAKGLEIISKEEVHLVLLDIMNAGDERPGDVQEDKGKQTTFRLSCSAPSPRI